MIELYGNENAPPPWQIFTVANNIREGNMHFVQKVFDGAFEVGSTFPWDQVVGLADWRLLVRCHLFFGFGTGAGHL